MPSARKATLSQPSLFGDGPRAATAPQRKTEPFVHLCQAPGCSAWGAYGFGPGNAETKRWLCDQHKHLGDQAHEHGAQ